MEKILQTLFDYQRFEKNARLEKLIGETEERYAAALSDDELGLVNAAGEFEIAAGPARPVSAENEEETR